MKYTVKLFRQVDTITRKNSSNRPPIRTQTICTCHLLQQVNLSVETCSTISNLYLETEFNNCFVKTFYIDDVIKSKSVFTDKA